jgi:crotonobetainyl-CoA:carnitine CoA-transferase CaiB-like acyl-CoA transferase
MVRVSGYGQTGPYSQRAGYGGIGEAMGGLRYIVGESDRPPSRVGISIGDSLAAVHACMGTLAALHHRDRTGAGQVIDAAIYESVLNMMESLVDGVRSARARTRTQRADPAAQSRRPNVYPTRDGIVMIGANQTPSSRGMVRRRWATLRLRAIHPTPTTRRAARTTRARRCDRELDRDTAAHARLLDLLDKERRPFRPHLSARLGGHAR